MHITLSTSARDVIAHFILTMKSDTDFFHTKIHPNSMSKSKLQKILMVHVEKNFKQIDRPHEVVQEIIDIIDNLEIEAPSLADILTLWSFHYDRPRRVWVFM